MKIETYMGQIDVRNYGDSDDILFLSTSDEPLAETLEYAISNRNVTARYWVTDKQVSQEKAEEVFIQTIMGKADCEFYARYSEITGYLWTDEEIKIGGHDLLEELKSFKGLWLILVVEVH